MAAVIQCNDVPSKSGSVSHISDHQFHRFRSKHCGRDSSGTLLHRVPEEQESTMTLESDATMAGDYLDPESGEWDKELEQRGLYRGSYGGYLALYTLSPFTAFLTFVSLAVLPSLVYPLGNEQWKDKYPPLFPFPFPELLTSIAFSALSHLLRTPLISSLSIFGNSQYATYVTSISVLASCALYTVAALFLRLSSFALLLSSALKVISSDSVISTRSPAFRIAWWTGLGWAIAEATIAVAQGYSSIGLYKDVFVSVDRLKFKIDNTTTPPAAGESSPLLKEGNGKGKQPVSPHAEDVPATRHREVVTLASYGACSQSHFEQASSSAIATVVVSTPTEIRPPVRQGSNVSVVTSSSFASLSLHPSVPWEHPPLAAEEGDIESEESELQVQVDRDIDHLLAFRKREEFEDLYGIPFISIPVSVSCLQRVNGFLQSVGFSLLLGAAYIYASFPTSKNLAVIVPQPVNLVTDALSPHPVLFLILSTVGIHILLTALHTLLLLPKLGVHTVVYLNSMVALGTLFAGLAVWGGVS